MPSISSVAAISRFSGIGKSAAKPRDILVGDMPPVFAQVRGDPVRASRGGSERRGAPGRDSPLPVALRTVAT